MTVAVVFIGTGKYLDFLPSWYERCEENFLPGVDKKYLVFTDGDVPEAPDNAIVYKQEHLDWPYITLYRFKIIQKALDEIADCDWLVFLDADMAVVDTVTVTEVFSDKPYLGVHHPCHFLKFPPHNQPPGSFETNPLSTAKVPDDYDFSVYWQGCLWGGKVPEVMSMMDELNARISLDEENNVIAQWHDESHLNAFYAQNKDLVHTLGPEFAFPEVFADACDFQPKIVHLAKDNSKYHV
ncbi:glycosyltransferase [Synechococcus virus S-PRM1]|uniref:Glycosyltransferase n=1 Tax=Synechococcus virus S-PRM1 TaxID=2100130 RepID=A0A346FKF5_9CAUD|nr:glycosyltransferase [Synechococcus virus S-PRM1]AXN58460.1 glycosyltransferase [Synechococcus virus S-PRM1]